jgi:hypothetical protein
MTQNTVHWGKQKRRALSLCRFVMLEPAVGLEPTTGGLQIRPDSLPHGDERYFIALGCDKVLYPIMPLGATGCPDIPS